MSTASRPWPAPSPPAPHAEPYGSKLLTHTFYSARSPSMLLKLARMLWTRIFGSRGKQCSVAVRLSVKGEGLPADDGKYTWHSVSRHGLVQQGITCSECGRAVAKPGDVHLIHVTRLGEAITCPHCNTILLASPDDAIDPVKPGESYDQTVYHAFVRPAGGSAVRRQRVMLKPAQVGEWVVIGTHEALPVEGEASSRTLDPPADRYGSEGRVVEIDGDLALVALAGNEGMGGAGSPRGLAIGGTWLRVRREAVFPMVLPSLRIGDRVSILRGPGEGQCGTIEHISGGKVIVRVGDERYETLIERIEIIFPDIVTTYLDTLSETNSHG